jgi:hypothetical protein
METATRILEPLNISEIPGMREGIKKIYEEKLNQFIPPQDTADLRVNNLQSGPENSGVRMSMIQEDSIIASIENRSPKIFATEMRFKGERVASIRNLQHGLSIMLYQTAFDKESYDYSSDFSLGIIKDEEPEATHMIHFSDNEAAPLTMSSGISKLFEGVTTQKELLEKVSQAIIEQDIPTGKPREQVIAEYMQAHNPHDVMESLLARLRVK